jgi:hypothetical protein
MVSLWGSGYKFIDMDEKKHGEPSPVRGRVMLA